MNVAYTKRYARALNSGGILGSAAFMSLESIAQGLVALQLHLLVRSQSEVARMWFRSSFPMMLLGEPNFAVRHCNDPGVSGFLGGRAYCAVSSAPDHVLNTRDTYPLLVTRVTLRLGADGGSLDAVSSHGARGIRRDVILDVETWS